MRSRHCAAECRLDRWSSCIRSMSDLGQSAVLTVRKPLPAFPHKQTFFRVRRHVSMVPGAETFTALRKAAARSAETICVTIGEILRALTPTECANYFRNSGYAQS